MEIFRNRARNSVQGSPELFSGTAFIDPVMLKSKSPSRITCVFVTFEPGARTAWHAHPSGQILIVTDGFGLVQERGKPAEKIFPGDVVWIPPDVDHWHGAAPHAMMKHIAIQEEIEGKTVIWSEKLLDEEYLEAWERSL